MTLPCFSSLVRKKPKNHQVDVLLRVIGKMKFRLNLNSALLQVPCSTSYLMSRAKFCFFHVQP